LKIDKLLAGTLALVLITGLGTPVFADPSVTGSGIETPFEPLSNQPLKPSTDEENVIFDNGRADPIFFPCGSAAGVVFCADDFILDTDEILTDVHFDGFDFLGTNVIPEFRYFIHADDNGLPGALIQGGDAVNEHKELIQGDTYRYWFDLDIPLALPGGTTFWLAIDIVDNAGFPEWVITENPIFGNPVAFTQDGGNTWQSNPCCDMNFVLTGGDDVVGGEFLPIDSTALLLAGAQTNAVWIMSALAVIGSVAFGALYLTSKKN